MAAAKAAGVGTAAVAAVAMAAVAARAVASMAAEEEAIWAAAMTAVPVATGMAATGGNSRLAGLEDELFSGCCRTRRRRR